MNFSKTFENQLDTLSPDEQKVLKAALKAVEHSYAPYSSYKVGAALLLQNGDLVQGSNQENVAYPSGLCAERTALFSYGAAGKPSPISYLAIVGIDKNNQQADTCSPCGACRQVMMEYENLQEKPYKVIFCFEGNIEIADSSASLLPFAFHF